MAPAMVPGSVPEAPDPAGTTWGVWEKRINWLVTILVLAATAYLSIKESLRPPSVLGPVPPVPVIIEPSPVDVPPPTSDVSTGILGTIAAGLSAPFGCSAAQQAIMRASSSDLLNCLLNVGAHEAGVAIRTWGDGYQIDGEGLGYDALGKALPCLAQFGLVSIATYARPAGVYAGSASEANVYRGDRIVVTVKPLPGR